MPPPPFPGEDGFLILEYTGKSKRVRRWPGAFTGARYRFGGDRRIGYVDARDGVKFVAQRTANGAQRTFKFHENIGETHREQEENEMG